MDHVISSHILANLTARCDLVALDLACLVASYGIDSSSILYDTSYATYKRVLFFCNAGVHVKVHVQFIIGRD